MAESRVQRLSVWLEQHPSALVNVSGTFYRVAGPTHTTARDVLSGEGPRRGGGRWNPPAGMRTVYLSEDPELALAESLAHFRYYGLPVQKGLPKVVLAVEVMAERVLDLAADGRKPPMPSLLREDWRKANAAGRWSASQELGRWAFDLGLSGLRVPSRVRRKGHNLVLFPDHLGSAGRLRLLNPELLERLGR